MRPNPYAIFGLKDPHSISPRLDPIHRTRRIDPNAPVVAAYLEGRPVILARPDPLTRRPGEPAHLTVPLTVSRWQHAMDIERGYDPRMWEPTPLIGVESFAGPDLAQLVQCCPWRLDQPRWLSQYEWTVVENAVQAAIASVRGTPLNSETKAMAMTLTGAIANQTACPSWKQSNFGPAPAVAVYNYGCLASWWGGLDPASQSYALADIASGVLLCRPNPPWLGCPLSTLDANWTPGTQSEYAPQRGYVASNVIADPCTATRTHAGYFPTTGAELVEMMRAVGGGTLSPELQQMVVVGGTVFANRSFVVGIEFRAQPDWTKMPESFSTLNDLMSVIDAMVEEAALIWAPGKGISIRQMLVTGKIDPAQLTALMQGLMPGVVGDLFGQLPGLLQALPGLLQGVPRSNVTHFVDQPPNPNRPGTSSVTGLAVVDFPGSQQNVTPPTQVRSEVTPTIEAKPLVDPGVALAALAIALGGVLVVRGYQTRATR